jgi:hypothetical protein
MKITLLVSTLILVGTAQAQITLNNANALAPGNVYIRAIKYQNFSPPVVPGNPGPSQTWNFTTAGSDGMDTSTTLAAGSLPSNFTAGHPQCNSAIQYGNNTTYYDLIRTDASGFYLEASVRYDQQFGTIHQTFSDPLKYMEWPCAYGTSWVDSAYSNYKYPTNPTDSIHEILNYTYDSEADAWGTLTLTSGAYNVLRIRRIISIFVTTAVYTPGGGWGSFSNFSDTIHFYEYWTDSLGIGWPIASIAIDDMGNVMNYTTMFSNQVSITENTLTGPIISVFPNPADDHITLKSENGSWEIVNAVGSVVKSGNVIASAYIDTQDLAEGIYMMSVTDETGIRSSTPFVVRR